MLKRFLILILTISLILPLVNATDVSAATKTALSITGSTPSQSQTDVDVAAAIQIKFNKVIVKGPSFAKMKLIDSNNKDVAFTAEISGENLYIRPKAPLSYFTQYSFSMPASAVKDKAGGNNKSAWKLTFKTMKKRNPIPVNITKEAEALVNGIVSLYGSGVPSPVSIFDAAWLPVVAGDEDAAEAPVFAAIRGYNNGRIMAVGHEGVLQDSYIGSLDNLKFLENSIQWLNYNGTGVKNVAVLSGHGEWSNTGNMTTLITDMVKKGYTFKDIPLAVTKDILKNMDVVIIGNAWSSFSASEIDALKSFVSQGGGLLLCGLGWSYSAYRTGSYPMNTLGAEFGIAFDNSAIAEYDNLLNGYPVFYEIYPNITSYVPFDQATAEIKKIVSEHQTNLDSALEGETGLYDRFLKAMSTLAAYENYCKPDDKSLSVIYGLCRDLAAAYPQYFSKGAPFDYAAYPKISFIREKMFRIWIDSTPLTESVKADIASTGHITGKYLDIWNKYTVYIADNSRLSDAQLGEIIKIFDAIPSSYQNVRFLSVCDFLGAIQLFPKFNGKGHNINIFGFEVGQFNENSFSDEVSPGIADIFSIVVIHEINHVVDALKQETDAKFTARRAALISEAGDDPSNYLRKFDPGFFTQNPQEFFASLSNDWFTDSLKTIQLGIEHFKNGSHNPIDQALFFADAYSNGGGYTYFYTLDAAGSLTCDKAVIGRDELSRITSISYKGTTYSFTLDNNGDVTGYDISNQ